MKIVMMKTLVIIVAIIAVLGSLVSKRRCQSGPSLLTILVVHTSLSMLLLEGTMMVFVKTFLPCCSIVDGGLVVPTCCDQLANWLVAEAE